MKNTRALRLTSSLYVESESPIVRAQRDFKQFSKPAVAPVNFPDYMTFIVSLLTAIQLFTMSNVAVPIQILVEDAADSEQVAGPRYDDL